MIQVRSRDSYVGEKYNRLTVIGAVKSNSRKCIFLCECGSKLETNIYSVRTGLTKSCGCLRREKAAENVKKCHPIVKHGMADTPEWSAYKDARRRCNNTNYKRYPDYGGRGIKFLFNSFEEFFKELGPRPEGLTLDRIDNNGHYEIGNVRWTTWKVQFANRRNTVKDLTGRVFGRLTVKGRHLDPKYGKKTYWVCACTCGDEKVCPGSSLRSGNTNSCGCYRKEVVSRLGKRHR